MEELLARLRRLYLTSGAIEEHDIAKFHAMVIQSDKGTFVHHDFRGGLSDDELHNLAIAYIHNIANLRGHLAKWVSDNGGDKDEVESVFKSCDELKLIHDLSNFEKHPFPPRDGGHSKKSPRLVDVCRVVQLSGTAMLTIGHDGRPRTAGDVRAVVTGSIVDVDGNVLGDLYTIASRALAAWEILLEILGLIRQ